MSTHTTLAIAGNTLAPAFAEIKHLGYRLKFDRSLNMLVATNEINKFIATDPISLLGLIKLSELRGMKPVSSDDEINDWLLFDSENT